MLPEPVAVTVWPVALPREYLPERDVLLSLEPEELSIHLLAYLQSLSDAERYNLNRFNVAATLAMTEYQEGMDGPVGQAIMEAWVVLENEGIVAPKPKGQGGGVFLTRRGKALKTRADLEAFRKARLLPRPLLHPKIDEKVWPPFLRGEYDNAIFGAFKEVEIAVRAAGNYAPTDIGEKLMRDAFDKDHGPLTDRSAPEADTLAVAHLFAGASAYYKNPGSHRHVEVADSADAVALILFASHLMRIVDSREPRTP